MNRKFTAFARARAPRTKAQGRPMGLLIAFLSRSCAGDPDEHRSALATLSHTVRSQHRCAAVAAGLYPDLFACERGVNDGDLDGEPLEQQGP